MTHVGYRDSTHVYMHTKYLHMHMFLHVYMLVANVASYLTFSLSYNGTIFITLFFLYRALAAHQGVEDEIAEEVESARLILLATSYLTEAFLPPELTVTLYYTRC